MWRINPFVEDTGHREFLSALLQRLANKHNMSIQVKFESARGGHGTAITELKRFIRDLRRRKQTLPDLLIVATDGNCKGYTVRKKEIDGAVKDFQGTVIYAIPDPHIDKRFERRFG